MEILKINDIKTMRANQKSDGYQDKEAVYGNLTYISVRPWIRAKSNDKFKKTNRHIGMYITYSNSNYENEEFMYINTDDLFTGLPLCVKKLSLEYKQFINTLECNSDDIMLLSLNKLSELILELKLPTSTSGGKLIWEN